jgi:hypothetical protein
LGRDIAGDDYRVQVLVVLPEPAGQGNERVPQQVDALDAVSLLDRLHLVVAEYVLARRVSQVKIGQVQQQRHRSSRPCRSCPWTGMVCERAGLAASVPLGGRPAGYGPP